jgi:hypothetical protein
MTSEAMSQMAPVLAPAVSQFIVEFAGDFVSQADNGTAADGSVGFKPDGTALPAGQGCYYDVATGLPIPAGQDGKIDFIVKNPGTANAVRSIRWYGMPRSTTGNTTINVGNGDVCPLRDTVRLAAGYNSIVNTPIERIAPATQGTGPGSNLLPNTFVNTPGDYNTVTKANGGMPSAATGGFFYICAWGPYDTVRPKLIRIVMTLEDTTGRLPDGQTYEYVFSLP